MIKPEHVIPKLPVGSNDWMVAGMVTGIEIEPSSNWLTIIEAFFAEFDETPQLGWARFTNDLSPKCPKNRGFFRNMRKKLIARLDDPKITKHTAVVSFKTWTYDDQDWVNEGFENSNVSFTIDKNGIFVDNLHRPNRPKTVVSFAINCPPATDSLEVSQRVEKLLIDSFAPLCGFVTLYPSRFPWGFPVNGSVFVPQGWDDSYDIEKRAFRDPDNIIYTNRVHRSPKDREWDFRPELGWLREVYTVNLINDRHLERPLNGATLSDYVASHGHLTRNLYGSQLHRWHVPNDIINAVRNDLEHSGLILASETEPLSL